MLQSYTFLGELARISATFLGELAMKSTTFLGELAKIRAIGFLNYFEAVQEILARHYLWRHQKIITHHTHHSMGSIIPIPLINLPHIKVGIYWRPVGIFTFAKHGRIKLLRSSAENHQATWFYLSLRNGYISHEHICDPSHAMSSDSIVPGQNEEVEYQYLYICTT